MNQQGIIDIMTSVGTLNLSEMEVQDQALYLMSISQFAERMKPLVVKYSDKMSEKSTFLFKV